MDDLIRDFVEESLESLDSAEAEVLRLDGPVNDAAHARAFRLLHTIKGTCGFLGLARLEALAHAGEDRIGQQPGAVDAVVLLKVFDEIRATLAHIAVHGVEAPAATPGDVAEDRAAAGLPGALVSADRLEQLLADVAELSMVRTQLVSAARSSNALALRAPVQRMSHVVDLLEARVAAAAMQRIEAAWRQVPRVVREIARASGKDIRVELTGGNTEIDRGAFGAVRDSIVHLVRNAAGHGVEPVSERLAAGKPAQGVISLAARQQADALVVTVADDGRGLASSAGNATAEVTLLSGRGVGLDAVREAIAGVGGTLDVRTEAGCGVTFEIRLPLVAGVVPCLLLTCTTHRFAIAQSSILEVARYPAGHGSNRFRSRHGEVPLFDLRLHLGLGSGDSGQILVCEEAGLRFGLVADRVEDGASLSVKPLAGSVGDIEIYAGAAVDASGQIVLALNTRHIARLCGEVAVVAPRIAAPIGQGRRGLTFRAGDARLRAISITDLLGVGVAGAARAGSAAAQVTRVLPAVVTGAPMQAPRSILVVRDGAGTVGLAVDEIGDFTLIDGDHAGPPGADGYSRVTTAGGELLLLAPDMLLVAERRRRGNGLPRVGIAEDDAFCRDFLSGVIEGFGYAAEHIEMIADAPADLAALVIDLDRDRDLEGMSAFQRAAALGVSSRLDGEAARRARVAGIQDVIGKFDRASLRHILEQRAARSVAA